MIFDYRGNPVKSADLKKELAAPTLSGVRTVWDQQVTGGLTPARLAAVLQNAAQGDMNDYLTLAEEMEERDLHYRCEISKRRLAVASLPVVVEAASDDEKDVMLADAVRAMAKKAGFRGLLKDLLDALGKGYSVCEIMWSRGTRWQPGRFEWRDPRFFTFDRTSRRKIRLLDEADMAEGIELAAYKYLVHLPHLKTGLPIRGGIARVAAWAFLFKNYTVKDWLAFCEVFGMPLRLGKYPSGALQPDIDILKLAVANLGSDAAAVIPESMMIDFVESGKVTGGDSLFMRLADWLDAQVSRGVLGQTATTQGTPGKLGGDEAQSEVREDIRDDDAAQLAETINRDLVKPFVDLNWGPQENYPELILRAVENEDLTVLTSAIEKLVDRGLKIEQSEVRDKFGFSDPADDAEILQAAGGQGQATAPVPPAERGEVESAQNREGAQATSPHPADLIADRLEIETESPIDRWLSVIESIIEMADSLEEAKEMLLAAFNELPAEKFAAVIKTALVSAEAAGRFDIEETGE